MDKRIEELNALEKAALEKLGNAQIEHENVMRILLLARKALTPQQLPKPTHYTMTDGGEWRDFKTYVAGNPPPNKTAHAIKFDNGAIFDMVNGWRNMAPQGPGENERLVPRYDNDTMVPAGQDGPSIPDCAYFTMGNFYSHFTGHAMGSAFHDKWWARREEFPQYRQAPVERIVSTDQRVVPRALLEVVAKTLENFVTKDHRNPPYAPEYVLAELKAALTTEKSELKAP